MEGFVEAVCVVNGKTPIFQNEVRGRNWKNENTAKIAEQVGEEPKSPKARPLRSMRPYSALEF